MTSPGWSVRRDRSPTGPRTRSPNRRLRLADFTERHRTLDLTAETVSVQVDGRLLGSALDRVRWELDLLRGWQRNPCFYLDQSLIPIFNLLLPPPPFDDQRTEAIICGALAKRYGRARAGAARTSPAKPVRHSPSMRCGCSPPEPATSNRR